MTVRELIERLSQCNPDLEVKIDAWNEDWFSAETLPVGDVQTWLTLDGRWVWLSTSTCDCGCNEEPT